MLTMAKGEYYVPCTKYQDQIRETFDKSHKLKGGVSEVARIGEVKLGKRDVTDNFKTTLKNTLFRGGLNIKTTTENYKQTQKNDQPKFQNQT